MNSVTNTNGVTFTVGDRVKNIVDGYCGTITAIKKGPANRTLLLVEPDDIFQVKSFQTWKLDPKLAARLGRTHHCTPRDIGLGMGCYELC